MKVATATVEAEYNLGDIREYRFADLTTALQPLTYCTTSLLASM